MKKRFIISILISLLLTISLTGLAADKISFWTFGTETPELKTVMEDFKKEFEAETGIVVDWRMIGWGDYHQSNLMVISSHEGPDVTQIGTTTVAQQAFAGVFDDVTNLFNELGGKEVFFKAMLTTTTPDSLEGRYAIPWFADPRALIYRKDLLDKYGLELPATWSDLVKVSKVLQEKGEMEYPVGLPGAELAHTIYQTVEQAGGAITTFENGKFKSNLTDSNVKKAIEFMLDQVTEYKIAAPASAEYDKATLRAKLANGEIAFMYDSPQIYQYLEQNAPELVDKIAVGPSPAGPAGKKSVFTGGSHLAIYNFTEKKEEAETWIKFLLRPENVAIWSKAYGNVPGLLSATKLHGFNEKPLADFIAVARDHGIHPPSNPGGTLAKVEDLINNQILGAYLEGKYDPDMLNKTLKEAENMHQRIIDQFEF